jgi:hypothetical protein
MQRDELERSISDAKTSLEGKIRTTIDELGAIQLPEIERLHRLEQQIEERVPGIAAALGSTKPLNISIEHVDALRSWLQSSEGDATLAYLDHHFLGKSAADVVSFVRRTAAATKLGVLREQRDSFATFRTLKPGDSRLLQEFVVKYDALRAPVFGFMFTRQKARSLDVELGQQLPVENLVDLHRRLGVLRRVCVEFSKARSIAETWHLSDQEFEAVYDEIIHRSLEHADCTPVHLFLETFRRALNDLGYHDFDVWLLHERTFARPSDLIRFCLRVIEFGQLWRSVAAREAKIPQFDFVADRMKLEQLFATKMTYEMDSRFLKFVEQAAATAKTLSSVIRSKQKFPKETFERLRDAFPCIIAGIRDFAEYIPLEHEMFDLVVIDEASQVSVAQAFPALLRAKKVLVLGDPKQFSNVKSANASKETNATWLTGLRQFFVSNISASADKLARASHFDVKRSVLEFFELIANYSVMLKKHFRGYQELISFSSEYFYGGALQAIKVRGKPIDEVIRFTVIDHDGRSERYRNTNSLEAQFILGELDALLEEEAPPTVGIITPFREQVALLSKQIFGALNGRDYQTILKLKIMTFDTCQGEERQIIFYSLVATKSHDALNYVFPVELKDSYDRVEEALKLQRLNVGFSRAQECIHFVLSKPIDQFAGSIRVVLQHYQKLLDERLVAEPDETDPASPMEPKVLQWIKATTFFQRHRDEIELQAQFPIGDYLKQLDPFYRHPAYRVDFLLTFRTSDRAINIVIEYDGFREHFIDQGHVCESNWSSYYRPEDIERQMVIESYGYKFLRLNRFNLGRDPVPVLSDRLNGLIETADHDEDHALVTRIHDDAEALATGDKKLCRKCDTVKDNAAFFDATLRGGQGGYGRYCMACKQTAKPKPGVLAGHRRWSRRRWRRR